MSNRELIAEARTFTGGWDEEVAKPRDIGSAMELIDRLAAAMEAMELPEGWRWTEARNGDHPVLRDPTVYEMDGKWHADFRGKNYGQHRTAREAMAALDGKDG